MKRIFLLALILGFRTPDALAANTYERVAEVIQLSVEFGSLRGNPDGTIKCLEVPLGMVVNLVNLVHRNVLGSHVISPFQ